LILLFGYVGESGGAEGGCLDPAAAGGAAGEDCEGGLAFERRMVEWRWVVCMWMHEEEEEEEEEEEAAPMMMESSFIHSFSHSWPNARMRTGVVLSISLDACSRHE